MSICCMYWIYYLRLPPLECNKNLVKKSPSSNLNKKWNKISTFLTGCGSDLFFIASGCSQVSVEKIVERRVEIPVDRIVEKLVEVRAHPSQLCDHNFSISEPLSLFYKREISGGKSSACKIFSSFLFQIVSRFWNLFSHEKTVSRNMFRRISVACFLSTWCYHRGPSIHFAPQYYT